MRQDLPLGLLAAQVTHAAGESSPGNLPDGVHAVALGCSVESLAALEQRLQNACIEHKAIREDAAPYEGQLMAIGIPPCYRDEVKKYVSSLPLLRDKEANQ